MSKIFHLRAKPDLSNSYQPPLYHLHKDYYQHFNFNLIKILIINLHHKDYFNVKY